ncbi:MAG: ABC transporter ATP-binding protein, partial [Treponema sp.]|nr:ABC transporter ATP-binding protein [Treponema sp.]
MSGISMRRLDFSYGENRIFDKLNLDMGKENPVVILGPSGCGKTTLLFLIAGLLKPSGGEILIDGLYSRGGPDSTDPGDSERRGPRRDTSPNIPAAIVFQEPRLLPWMSALENAALPIERRLGKKAARERALYFLELAGLGDKAKSRPGELSGGQRQRVNLARAFAFPSPVILLDEPFQSQDIPLKLQLMDLVMTLLNREEGRLVAAVTHDPREAVYLGRRIIVLGRPKTGAALRTVPVFDESLSLAPEDRAYLSPAQLNMERRL